MMIDGIAINQTHDENHKPAAQDTRPPETSSFSESFRAASANRGTGLSATDFDVFFEEASQKYNLPVNFLKAVAKVESGFRPHVVSSAGAMGVMQLMPNTAKSLGVTDPFDPRQNILGGAKYLREQIDRFDGDVELALAAYNAGWPTVQKHGGIPYESTRNYVNKIMGLIGDGGVPGVASVPIRDSGRASPTDTGATPAASEPDSDEAKQTGSSGDFNIGQAMTQVMLMKIIEMQMNSSNKDDKKSIF